jgi:hypothetical protein
MAYHSFKGVKYGVCSHRPIWKSLLVSIPIINLFYTKKIKVSLTSRRKEGTPMIGITGQFRIFRWHRQVKFRFIVPERFTYVWMRVTNPNDSIIYRTGPLDKDSYESVHEYHWETKLVKHGEPYTGSAEGDTK